MYGKGPCADSKRYQVSASARSKRLVDSMLSRLQTYRTFQPVLASNGLYGRGAGKDTDEVSRPTSAQPDNGLWDVVDDALEASSSYLLRHNYGDHFIATMNSRLKDEKKTKARVTTHVIDLREASRPAAADAAAPLQMASAANSQTGVDVDRFALDAWSRDHPTASETEKRAYYAMQVRERQAAARSDRQRNLREMQNELKSLLDEDTGTRPTTGSSACGGTGDGAGRLSHSTGAPEPPPRGQTSELEAQRAEWERFAATDSDRQPSGAEEPSADGYHPPTSRILCDYDKDASLVPWIEGEWRSHTHIHENAAMTIQCAYRCFVAKTTVSLLRCTRLSVFHESLRAEDVARQQWAMSLRIAATQSSADGEAERTVRALQFFSNRILATAEVRRARHVRERQEEEELRAFAALAIQRVYRGHCARTRVMYLRHPEMVEAIRLRTMTAAAIYVQSIWRGFTTRATMEHRRRAAGIVQRAFRSHVARVRARALRALRKRENAGEVHRYAAAVIGRCCLSYIVRRRHEKQLAAAAPVNSADPEMAREM